MTGLDNRRPIAARTSGWAEASARFLAHRGVGANAISAASLAFALLAAAFILLAPAVGSILWLAAAAAIGLRLLANMLDGMVAVEHGQHTPTGPLWNELPDRVSDVVILATCGYAAAALTPSLSGFAVALGWICAAGALLTAYVREFGRALGHSADFCGPFAKQQRMAAIIAAAIISAAEPVWGGRGEVLLLVLATTAAGTLATAARRTLRLAKRMAAK